MKMLVIIPAYNEEASVAAVVGRVKSCLPEADILVVNDGSHDRTAERAENSGARVIELSFNLGIGGAMQTGYMYAKRWGYEIAVQVDADGQHDPSYIKTMLEPVMEGRADVVIGSRYVHKTTYRSTFLRRTGMVFFSVLVRLLTGLRVKDTTSGFRVVNRKVIEYFADRYPSDYPEVDVLIKLYKRHFWVAEVPVEMAERQGGKSSITLLRSVYYMVKVSLSLIIGALRPADR